jgi:hypothetical protein
VDNCISIQHASEEHWASKKRDHKGKKTFSQWNNYDTMQTRLNIYTNFNETIQLKTCEKQHIKAIIKIHQVPRMSVLFIPTPFKIACMIISNSIIDVLPYIIYVGFILD